MTAFDLVSGTPVVRHGESLQLLQKLTKFCDFFKHIVSSIRQRTLCCCISHRFKSYCGCPDALCFHSHTGTEYEHLFKGESQIDIVNSWLGWILADYFSDEIVPQLLELFAKCPQITQSLIFDDMVCYTVAHVWKRCNIRTKCVKKLFEHILLHKQRRTHCINKLFEYVCCINQLLQKQFVNCLRNKHIQTSSWRCLFGLKKIMWKWEFFSTLVF